MAEAALTDWMVAHVAGFRGPLTLTRLSGGQSNPTWRVDAASGRYVLRHDGQGQITVEGRVSNVDIRDGEIRFDYTPGPGLVSATITRTEAADPIRNITVVREDRLDLHSNGAIFNPDWLARLRGARLIRFMDWILWPIHTPTTLPCSRSIFIP
jgi:hypothetical protein